ncbi:hypothetical protein Pst134EA_026783 [Puccinia striiformis f. sp. tritici]|uniref:hypothetical protein n=1 Tax=Puccinia striiformis f. sp. tritici TaxID=168172 RepID=UPI0020089114|nr:hypothetical protein Pst134EA_026783 [Puccinia striiformis f. sp. tritici]KAH9450073.1 hypothetical protein Pst134EA_026783 [Puccinia striiformis f. sp. tritici]
MLDGRPVLGIFVPLGVADAGEYVLNSAVVGIPSSLNIKSGQINMCGDVCFFLILIVGSSSRKCPTVLLHKYSSKLRLNCRKTGVPPFDQTSSKKKHKRFHSGSRRRRLESCWLTKKPVADIIYLDSRVID